MPLKIELRMSRISGMSKTQWWITGIVAAGAVAAAAAWLLRPRHGSSAVARLPATTDASATAPRR